MQDLLLSDVTPLPMGVETGGGVTTKLIQRNTTIPPRRLKPRRPMRAASQSAYPAFRGHATMTKDNDLPGRFQLDGIPPAPRVMPQME